MKIVVSDHILLSCGGQNGEINSFKKTTKELWVLKNARCLIKTNKFLKNPINQSQCVFNIHYSNIKLVLCRFKILL